MTQRKVTDLSLNKPSSPASKLGNPLIIKKILLAILCVCSTSLLYGQWLDWQDVTDSHLTLSSVANTDDEEKDMASADLNNDGFPDIIVVRKEPFSNATEPPKSDLLLMNVDGKLVDQTSSYAPEFISNPSYARDVFIGDFDSDGWLDVIIANTFEQQPMYFKNRGLDANNNWLGLVDESASRFPLLTSDELLFCAVWGGDINGNGAMDIYFNNYSQNNGLALDFLLINDGTGHFTDESQSRLGDFRNSAFGTSIEIHDMDNDGDNDILKTSVLYDVAPWNGQGLYLLFNDGTGHFPNTQKISVPTTGTAIDAPYMFTVADFNQDNKLDLYVVDDTYDYQLIANTMTPDAAVNYISTEIFSPRTQSFGGNVHHADLDLDGDLDVAACDVDVDIPPCMTSNRKFAFLENVNGLFQDSYLGAIYPWDQNVYDFCFIDINNDGLKDVVLGKCSGYSVFLSDNCFLVTSASDFDGDGLVDACDPCPANPAPDCTEPPGFAVVDTSLDIARQWNELLLESIRKDFARPTVHARNLFHTSIAMWDAWATYHPGACTYLLGQTVDGFSCNFNGIPAPADPAAATREAISFAAYRLLQHRFANSPGKDLLLPAYDFHMAKLGYNFFINTTDYSTGSPAALGNYIAQCIIDFGLQDNSNEQMAYTNQYYQPVNTGLSIEDPGNPTITDYNRWQPLTLQIFIDQSGNVIPGATPEFLSPEWGAVSPFALSANNLTINNRNGFNYWIYHDPGTPPYLQMDGSGQTADYQWNFLTTLIWSAHLDSSDGVMVDISPGVSGNSAPLPEQISDYPNFYDQINGGSSSLGHPVNPSTGTPYPSNVVPRGDFARVLAEFWADGPDSETPPGHWFTLLNYVADHPDFIRKFEGQGNIMQETEWYVKSYLAMGGAMHDAAIASWGAKGWYDYIRPVSAIRAMAELGQSSNPTFANYHPAGIPLVSGYIEIIKAGDPLAGSNNENLDKFKAKAWRGHSVIDNVDTDVAGVGWILLEAWVPYQRPSFVTPPFAGFVSGHSTFSRAAAEVLTLLTGDPFFPGGMGTHLAAQDEFLVFENGPSVDIELQWATYQDAADQSAISRIWGGIHPPADDIPGRKMGIEIGRNAFQKAKKYFTDLDQNGIADHCDACDDIRVLNTDHQGNQFYHWQVSDYIEATNLIPDDADIIYDAGNCVLLKAGFEVEQGAIFEVKTEGCVE